MSAALGALVAVGSASARAEVGNLAIGVAREAVRFLVEREVGGKHRVAVRVGKLDPNLRLSPCARMEPFVPPALRLWGRTSIGVRCVEGARWSVLLPVTVSVFGKALVATATLPAGSSPSAGDFRIEEVDLTREVAPVVGDTAALEVHLLTRSLSAGQTLRQDALRAVPSIEASTQDFAVGRRFANVAKLSR